MSVHDVIGRAFAQIDEKVMNLTDVAHRFVAWDRISKRSDRRDDALRTVRESVEHALTKEGRTVANGMPAAVTFSRALNNGHGFDLAIDQIGSITAARLDEDTTIALLDAVIYGMQLAELDWIADGKGTETLTLSLVGPSGPSPDAEPDSEHDAIRIELYRDHGHFGTNDRLPAGAAECHTCDRLAARLATALHEFQEGLR